MATGDETGFKHLRISGWRQFGSLDLDFHPQVTMLTGANATGKTTVLALLATHFDWRRRWVRVRNPDGTFAAMGEPGSAGFVPAAELGELTYTNGVVASFTAPRASSPDLVYNVSFAPTQTVEGLYLTSHRVINSYTAVKSIPAQFGSAANLLQSYSNEVRNLHNGELSRKSPFAWMKESLIAAAVFGEGSASVEPDPVARRIWQEFQPVLASLFPDDLGFVRLVVRNPEVIVRTRTGEFSLDESSGGLSALMELGWQIFLRSFEHGSNFVVLLDEPENHLHPELQRRILPNLLKAFPSIQFIVASHSPFVVTSVPESNVYVLDYDVVGSVGARLLDLANKAAGADETLRRVLGLDTTIPLWAEARLDSIVQKYLARGVTSEALAELRAELADSGMASSFPEAVVDALDSESDPQAGTASN